MKIYHKILLLPAVMSLMTACSYTNHFSEEGNPDPGAPYQVMTDLDASDYGTWTYVNLETGQTEKRPDTSEWYYAGTATTLEARSEEDVSIDWHIAVHRYEIRTNGAKALNTHVNDMESVSELPNGDYAADETVNYFTELSVTGRTQYLLPMDMSAMMDGNIGYALNGKINRVLSDAITRTETGTMPPTIYGSTGEVFALQFTDGNWATMKITKTYGGSDGARSGMMSFQYKFHRKL